MCHTGAAGFPLLSRVAHVRRASFCCGLLTLKPVYFCAQYLGWDNAWRLDTGGPDHVAAN
ncbi:hypothetical protein Srufu_046660 [Streptomyces libani subsp. rufus]|nr:hypothetical protein Srufu_046660 [Streptomyces libani subsp. rufus]